jgi:hypothetical protein
MYPLLLISGLFWVLNGVTHAAGPDSSTCVRLEVDTVTVTGTLERLTFPGPPNYESVAGGDTPETGYYLALKDPLCILPNPTDPESRSSSGGTLVQLVLDSAGYDRLRPTLGQQVTLRGILSEGITGHHHTPYLLTVAHP